MSDGCSKSHLEMVRLVRFRTISDEFMYMVGKIMEFLIDLYGFEDSMFYGYGEFHLFTTYFGAFLLTSLFLVRFQLCHRKKRRARW